MLLGAAAHWLQGADVVADADGLTLSDVSWHAVIVANNIMVGGTSPGPEVPSVVQNDLDDATRLSRVAVERALSAEVAPTAGDLVLFHVLHEAVRSKFRELAQARPVDASLPGEESRQELLAWFGRWDVLAAPAEFSDPEGAFSSAGVAALWLRLHGQPGGNALLHWWIHQLVVSVGSGEQSPHEGAMRACLNLLRVLLKTDHDSRGADLAAQLCHALFAHDPGRPSFREARESMLVGEIPDVSPDVWRRFCPASDAAAERASLVPVLVGLWKRASRLHVGLLKASWWQSRFLETSAMLARNMLSSGERTDPGWHRLIIDCLRHQLQGDCEIEEGRLWTFPPGSGCTIHSLCSVVMMIRDAYARRDDDTGMVERCDQALALAHIAVLGEAPVLETMQGKPGHPNELDKQMRAFAVAGEARRSEVVSLKALFPAVETVGDFPQPEPSTGRFVVPGTFSTTGDGGTAKTSEEPFWKVRKVSTRRALKLPDKPS